MSVLVRYLSGEAIENCVLCLNYKFDKVVFLAHQRVRAEESSNIDSFLKNECHINEITYVIIDEYDIEQLIDKVENIIKKNNCIFDLTGCDGMCQVALYNVATKNNIPLYIYDIEKTQLKSLNNKEGINSVTKQKIKMTIKKYIRMVGGIVDENKDKSYKRQINSNYFERLIEIRDKYKDNWTAFSSCMHQFKNNTRVECKNIKELISQSNQKISVNIFMDILEDLKRNNLIIRYAHEGNMFAFSYASNEIKNIVTDAGSILEMLVYRHERVNSDDCAIGATLDWDGIIEQNSEDDVNNEIDVLRLDNYELTFISCKDTKEINRKDLYELESITRRFGGKYSKMKLVYGGKATKSNIQRAKLIGIELISLNDLLDNNL